MVQAEGRQPVLVLCGSFEDFASRFDGVAANLSGVELLSVDHENALDTLSSVPKECLRLFVIACESVDESCFTLAAKLRSEACQTYVPILVIVDGFQSGELERLARIGVNSCLVNPKPEALAAVIHYWAYLNLVPRKGR